MRRTVCWICTGAVMAACGDARDVSQARPGAAGPAPATGSAGEASPDWPGSEEAGINLRRERAARLTGAAQPDIIVITARGPRFDSLDVRLVIHSAAGDTLWSDEWNSAYYFYYDPAEGRTRLEIGRTVQAHVDTLLHESRFSERGMPALMRGADYGDLFRESVRYHLAELDWRNRAGLQPAEPTPREAYDRINVEHVVPARVGVVRSEVSAGPTYWYYAGGEASYVIGWSVREHAFVRIFSCC
jgi:hypothetical protein